MSYRWLTDLDLALASAGISYAEVPPSKYDPVPCNSWRDRGRPPSVGGLNPEGVLCHHTADPQASVASNLAVILKGNSEAPGPICQLYISREPAVYLVAAGRANHGGKGMIPGETACTDMNARLIGIEVSNDGVGETWASELTELYARVVAALLDHYGWSEEDVFLHATTGPPCSNYKIDPAGPWVRQPDSGQRTWDLNTWRSYVAGFRNDPLHPDVPPDEEDEVAAVYARNAAGAVLVSPEAGVWHTITGAEFYGVRHKSLSDADVVAVDDASFAELQGAVK